MSINHLVSKKRHKCECSGYFSLFYYRQFRAKTDLTGPQSVILHGSNTVIPSLRVRRCSGKEPAFLLQPCRSSCVQKSQFLQFKTKLGIRGTMKREEQLPEITLVDILRRFDQFKRIYRASSEEQPKFVTLLPCIGQSSNTPKSILTYPRSWQTTKNATRQQCKSILLLIYLLKQNLLRFHKYNLVCIALGL